MTYGLTVNIKELEIIENSGIEFDYYDPYDLVDDDSYQAKRNKYELEFEFESNRDKALELIGRR